MQPCFTPVWHRKAGVFYFHRWFIFVRWSEKKTSYPFPACFIDFLALNRRASYSGVISMLCSLVSRIRYFYERYTKELSFLSEMVCKKSRGWIGLWGPGAIWNRVFYLNTTPSLILERGSEWDLMFSVICLYFLVFAVKLANSEC